MGMRYRRLERKIESAERKAHPGYSRERVSYIAHAAAGNVARLQHIRDGPIRRIRGKKPSAP